MKEKGKGREKEGRKGRGEGGEGVHDGENVHKVHANLSAKLASGVLQQNDKR